jgi:hypothetical protein
MMDYNMIQSGAIGGPQEGGDRRFQFPWKLHEMLTSVRSEGKESIVSWQPHGRAFRAHNRELFAATIMPIFFKQTKYKSFQRQLNLWGFTRIVHGEDRGAYYHEHFLRDQPDICRNMYRQKIKGQLGKDIHGTSAVELLAEPRAATQHEILFNVNRSAENARLLSMMQSSRLALSTPLLDFNKRAAMSLPNVMVPTSMPANDDSSQDASNNLVSGRQDSLFSSSASPK